MKIRVNIPATLSVTVDVENEAEAIELLDKELISDTVPALELDDVIFHGAIKCKDVMVWADSVSLADSAGEEPAATDKPGSAKLKDLLDFQGAKLKKMFDELQPGDHWSQHPHYLREDWGAAASDGDTTLGYWDWVAGQLDCLCGGELPAMTREAMAPFVEAIGTGCKNLTDEEVRIALIVGITKGTIDPFEVQDAIY